MTETTSIPLCFCGCGKQTKQARNGCFNKFVLGHNVKTNQTSINGHSGQFKPGNTMGKGRPNGSKNTATIAAENLISGESVALSRKLVELALDGNVACLKTAMERLIPVCKSKPIILPNMPRIDSIADASELTAFIINAVADGIISPVDGEILSRSAERHIKALEVKDIELRLTELENRLSSKH
ncbi:MAG: hypothetical protein HGB26_01370 [Desulfobulbaceae bacterium]|nr:hypothetical protein [Desulfobulbaceae bacterium]